MPGRLSPRPHVSENGKTGKTAARHKMQAVQLLTQLGTFKDPHAARAGGSMQKVGQAGRQTLYDLTRMEYKSLISPKQGHHHHTQW